MQALPIVHEQRRIEWQAPLPLRAIKPVVVFDMAFREDYDHRRVPIVSGAAQSLAGVLSESNIATPLFMDKPFFQGGSFDLTQGIDRKRPLVFLLSVYDFLLDDIFNEVNEIRKRHPEAIIILGGSSVNTAEDLTTFKSLFPEVDAVVKGDGEKPLLQILSSLKDGKIDINHLWEIGAKGMHATVGDRMYLDNRVNVLSSEELNALPKLTAYSELIRDINERKALVLNTSRSCKYRCVFCSHKYHDHPIFWTAERIIEELRHVKKLIKQGELPEEARTITFNDDDFFLNRARSHKFLSLVAEDPELRNYFRFNFASSIGSFLVKGNVNSKLLYQLSQINVESIHFGTDGFSDIMIRLLGKSGYDWQQAKAVIAAVSAIGIKQKHYGILSHHRMNYHMFSENLGNLVEVMANTPRMKITITFSLIAFEGTKLMVEALRLFPDRVGTVKNIPGRIIKYLPFDVPLSCDSSLNETIAEALRRPFRTVEELEEGLRTIEEQETDDDYSKRLLKDLILWRSRQPKDYSVREAINCHARAVSLMALQDFYNATRREENMAVSASASG